MSANSEGKAQPTKGMLQKELGQRIVRVRKRRGWRQGDLARRLGVPRERLGKWERGVNSPSLEDLSALSEVLELPLEELGLGRRRQEPISSTELVELIAHFTAMGRLLKPWLPMKKQG